MPLEKLRKLFLWQHITEEDYLREQVRLEELRVDLTAGASRVSPTIRLEGISDAWQRGDATTRHDLLANLFHSLIVREGVATEYVPRQDRGAEVISLMTAVGRLHLAKRGKGGIRTLEGVSHPLPA